MSPDTQTREDKKNDPLLALAELDRLIKRVGGDMDQLIQPVRQTAFTRYPVLFSFLVTFGVVATFLGLEQILLQVDFLVDRPWIIFVFGLVILAITGRLYSKLG